MRRCGLFSYDGVTGGLPGWRPREISGVVGSRLMKIVMWSDGDYETG